MIETIEKTNLWKRTLGEQENDQHKKARQRLRNSLSAMRDNAAELVKLIPEDCKGLTVHDVSHLDALWEIADLVCGDSFAINPAEAFVFGAAVLIHDAGMSIASYPGGLDQLQNTTEWRDAAFAILKRNGLKPTDDLVNKPSEPARSEIVFNVLRSLHAKHAEELAVTTWPLPKSNESVRLLEDVQLRTAYGRTIGRIGHSHHWSTEKVTQLLRNSVGPADDLPPDWIVNEIKVACLLRCADAAHIDRRRAPTFLYALKKPQGVSQDHWSFQNKLNKPTISGDTLIYSSGEQFALNDASAWWLCYDTINMIDSELKDSNGALIDNSISPFAARRVFGADGPLTLARQVQVSGWRPVDAEIRVSDPIHLAKTLGGKNLYGSTALAPIRELIQNAIDAVRARRKHQKREPSWGKIRIIVEDRKIESGVQTWLHVDDNGIGMSERTLTGSLLDFGRSLWSSSLLREEWPGLESSGHEPIGKFGIGFFSVFILSETIRVISKRYDAAASDARVLQFDSLNARPILRDAFPNELPTDFTTRVSAHIANDGKLIKNSTMSFEDEFSIYGGRSEKNYDSTPIFLKDWMPNILSMISGVDVDIELDFKSIQLNTTHSGDWQSVDCEVFLTEVLAKTKQEERDQWIAGHKNQLSLLSDDDGNIHGRAALSMYSQSYRNHTGGHSVGGLVTLNSQQFVGIINGETNIASRNRVKSTVPEPVMAAWATRQAELIDQKRFEVGQLFSAARNITEWGGNSKTLPYAFAGGKFVTYDELTAIIKDNQSLFLLLSTGYRDQIELINITDLRISGNYMSMLPNVAVLEWSTTSDKLFSEERSKEFFSSDGGVVAEDDLGEARPIIMSAFELVSKILGKTPTMQLEKMPVYDVPFYRPPAPSWVLSIRLPA